MLLIKEIYICLRSSTEAFTFFAFFSSKSLPFAFFIKYSVFRSHLRSSWIIVPRCFVLFIISRLLVSIFSLVLNWCLLVKFKSIIFDFVSLIIIFLFLVHSDMLLRYSWVFKVSGGMNWLCVCMSEWTDASFIIKWTPRSRLSVLLEGLPFCWIVFHTAGKFSLLFAIFLFLFLLVKVASSDCQSDW